MPAAASKQRSKGKSRADPYEKVTAALPLGKQLAHTDKKVRDQAIRNLTAFVSRGDAGSSESAGYTPLSHDEMSKLWKGLFYCFWMSDKPLVQQRLAADLAELVLLIDPVDESARFEAAVGFLAGFWEAMGREWAGLDRLRQDKFYLLMRRYVNATFRLLAREAWSSEAVEAVNKAVAGPSGPLSWQDRRIPMSLSTHLADVYPDELDKVLALPEVSSQPPCPLVQVLQPLTTLLCRTPTATVHSRILDSVHKPIINALALAATASGDRPSKQNAMYAHIALNCRVAQNQGDNRASPAQLRSALLKNLFETAAQAESVESNRRKVYAYWREAGGDDEEDDEE